MTSDRITTVIFLLVIGMAVLAEHSWSVSPALAGWISAACAATALAGALAARAIRTLERELESQQPDESPVGDSSSDIRAVMERVREDAAPAKAGEAAPVTAGHSRRNA